MLDQPYLTIISRAKEDLYEVYMNSFDAPAEDVRLSDFAMHQQMSFIRGVITTLISTFEIANVDNGGEEWSTRGHWALTRLYEAIAKIIRENDETVIICAEILHELEVFDAAMKNYFANRHDDHGTPQ